MIQAASHATSKSSIKSRTIIIVGLMSLVYLQVFLTRATGIPFRTFFDFLVLSIFALLLIQTLMRKRINIDHLWFFVSIFVFTTISSLGSLEPSFSTSIISSIVFSKFIIVFSLARYVDVRDLGTAMGVFSVIHVVGCLGSLLFPSFFESLLPSTSFQLDTSRLMGFSLNANRAAAASSILFLYYAFYAKKLLPSALFFMLLLFSESRSLTLITGIVFAFLVFSARMSASKKLAIFSIGVISFSTVLSQFLAYEETVSKITNTLFGDLRYIRAAMLFGGWNLANEFFPFGVGGGMFGSSMSQGSQAYEIIGIASWSTVVDMTGVFDSGFGAILGEYGYSGLLAYILILGLTLKYALRKHVYNKDVIFLLGLILFMSFFRTVASDFFFAFYFLFLYLLISNNSFRRKADLHAHLARP